MVNGVCPKQLDCERPLAIKGRQSSLYEMTIKVLKVLREGGIIAEEINPIIPSIEVPTGVDFID